MKGTRQGALVLSVHPFARGVAFALFEAALSPIDWGVKDVRGDHKNARSLEITKRLIERWQPDVLILADASGTYGRAQTIQRLRRLIRNHAEGQSIEVQTFARTEVQDCFKAVGARTRYEIAQAIASRITAFGARLPPVPNLWANQHVRMTLFDAAALAMTFYCRSGQSLDEIDRWPDLGGPP